MAIVLVQMPSVNPAPLVRATQCPYADRCCCRDGVQSASH